MSDGCYIDYKGTSTIKVPYSNKELLQVEEEIKNNLLRQGKNMNDPDAVAEEILKVISSRQKSSTQDAVKRLDTFGKLSRISEKVEEMRKAGLKKKTIVNRLVGMVFNTNETKGITPFELMMKGNESMFLADFFNKVKSHIGDLDPADYLKNKTNLGKVLTEYNEFFKNPNATKSKTGDVTAFNVGRELFDAQYKIAEVKKISGKNTIVSDLRLRPKWSNRKIKNADRNQFVNEIANALDPKVHGEDITVRQQKASELYDNMIKDDADWRLQGDKDPVNLDKNVWIPDEDRTPTFAFADGDAYTDIIQKYSDTDLASSLLLQFNEMSRESALIQFLGADYKNGFEQFSKILDDAGDTQGAKAAKHYLKHKINPQLIEHNTGASYMAAVRNVQAASKLGGASITAIMDIPAMIFSGRQIFGLPLPKLLASVFQYGYKGAPQDYAKYAEKMLMGCDTYLNNIGDRFGHMGSGAGGAIEDFTSVQLANRVFKMSGLNWWTEGRRAMALGMYGHELGTLIKTTDWDSIKPRFKQQLEKFGVNKKDWATLKNTKNITDADGRLDIHALKDMDWETSYGKSTLKQKLAAAFRDAQDTMVMTPSDFDVAAGALFNEPGTWGSEVIKTLFQFKSHPIAYTRKVIARAYKNNDKVEFLQNMTILTAEMMLVGVAVVQIKEFLKGNQPRRFDDANLYIRAAEQSGAWGLWSDTILQFGGATAISQFTDEPESAFMSSADKSKQLLGPFLSDIIRMTDIPGDLAERHRKNDWDGLLNETTSELLSYAPFQNIWWGQMFKRYLIEDYWKQRTDPKGYRKQQKRIKKAAKKNRIGGKPKNIAYETIEGIFE